MKKTIITILIALFALNHGTASAQQRAHRHEGREKKEEVTQAITGLQITAWWATQRFRAEMRDLLPYLNGLSSTPRSVGVAFEYYAMGEEPYTSPVYYLKLNHIKPKQRVQIFLTETVTKKLLIYNELTLKKFMIILKMMSTPQVEITSTLMEDGTIRVDAERNEKALPSLQDQVNYAALSEWNTRVRK